MSFKTFITSKGFIITVIAAALIVFGLTFGSLKYLNTYTQHGKEIQVPNLIELKIEEARNRIGDGFEIIVIDTIDFNPKIAPLTISEQDPVAGYPVKQGRKVYVKINASGYSSVRLPNLEGRTLRHSIAILESLQLLQGSTTYQEDFAKDVVLSVRQDGRILRAGDKVLKNSKIDFVLGDGSLSYLPAMDTLGEMYESIAPAIDSIF